MKAHAQRTAGGWVYALWSVAPGDELEMVVEALTNGYEIVQPLVPDQGPQGGYLMIVRWPAPPATAPPSD